MIASLSLLGFGADGIAILTGALLWLGLFDEARCRATGPHLTTTALANPIPWAIRPAPGRLALYVSHCTILVHGLPMRTTIAFDAVSSGC